MPDNTLGACSSNGLNPNLTLPAPNANPDTTAAMTSVLECMTLQQCTYHIPFFDGRNPPLKEFLQDVANGGVFVTDATEPGFIRAVLSKLKGAARESVRDKQFEGINDLVKHLKKRFASSKKYQWYLENIINIRLKQTETVSDYHDRLQGLLSGARHALETKYNSQYRKIDGGAVRVQNTPESEIMMWPIIDCALEAFIRGLPEEMSTFVDTRNPTNLEEAFEHALRAEERHKYTSRGSSYHISRSEEHPRPPSPYSRQVERNPNSFTSDKRKVGSDKESNPAKTPRNPTNEVLQFTPEQLATFYRSMMPQYAAFPPQIPSMMYPPPPVLQNPTSYPPISNPQYQSPPQSSSSYQRQENNYKTSSTPPRAASPGPQGNLNFNPARRFDATPSPVPQRQRSVQFADNSIKSYEQEDRSRTPQ